MQFCDDIPGVKGCTAGVYLFCTESKGLNCSTCGEVFLHKGSVINMWQQIDPGWMRIILQKIQHWFEQSMFQGQGKKKNNINGLTKM